MQLTGCHAIVTGGASGMGAATAKALSKAGARVAIFDLDQHGAKKTAQAIQGLAIECDITNSLSVEKALQQTIAAFKHVRICINCAGIVSAARMVGKEGPLPLDQFRRVIEINLIGTFNVMRLVAAHMMTLPILADSGERGVVINTASIAAYEGQIGQTAYSASKGGIVGMTLPAARELADHAIRVVTIAPGPMDTPLFDNLSPTVRQQLINAMPFPKRLGFPEEYARLALHIIDNPLINGEIIRLDGAARLGAR